MKIIYIAITNNTVVLNDFAAQALMKFLDLYCEEPVIKYVKMGKDMICDLSKLDDEYDFLIINNRQSLDYIYLSFDNINSKHTILVFSSTTTLNDILNFIHSK